MIRYSLKKIQIKLLCMVSAFLDVLLPHGDPGDRLRGIVMTPLFKKCGKNLKIKKGVFFVTPENVSIGDNVFIGNYVNIGAGDVFIGNEVILGPMCCLFAQNHTAIGKSYRFGNPVRRSIVIGNGSWIGSLAILLPGTHIGEGCLVGAGVHVRSKVSDGAMIINNSKQRQIVATLTENMLD